MLARLLAAVAAAAVATAAAVHLHDTSWWYLGPFTAGKAELEGTLDVIAAFANRSQPLQYASELAAGGHVAWTQLQAVSGGAVDIQPPVDWQSLYNAIGVPVLEHFGWAVTTLHVKQSSRVRVACKGVTAAYLRPKSSALSWESLTAVPGDIYHTGRVAAYLPLPAGRYELYAYVRAKMRTSFSCTATPVARSAKPSVNMLRAPDVWRPNAKEARGVVLGDLLAVEVVNPTAAWVRNVSCRAVPANGLMPASASESTQQHHVWRDAASGIGLAGLRRTTATNGSAALHPFLDASWSLWSGAGAAEATYWRELPVAPGGSVTLPCSIGVLRDAADVEEAVVYPDGAVGEGGDGSDHVGRVRPLVPATCVSTAGFEHGAVAVTVQVVAQAAHDAPPSIIATFDHALRCRTFAQSAMFAFADHDGSVQSAAVVAPLPLTTPPPTAYGGARLLSVQEEEQEAWQHGLPVLLSMHGTGVSAQSQCDAYKYMPPRSKEYEFGVEGYWLLAPSRHGAHNWQGTGQLHAVAALQALALLTRRLQARSRSFLTRGCPNWRAGLTCAPVADATRVLFAGHSMGGHGAWHAATALPDIAIAAAPAAGWLVKESYGDSNVFMQLDTSEPFVQAGVRSAMLSSVADQRADAHVSNLRGIPVHVRVGAKDATTHPFYSRRMVRMLRAARSGGVVSAADGGDDTSTTWPQLEEVPNQEHWWWDTQAANDGGVVNDPTMRAFYRAHRTTLSVAACWNRVLRQLNDDAGSGGDACRLRQVTAPRSVDYVVTQPAVYRTGRMGVRVLAQVRPQEPSHLNIESCTVDGAAVLRVRTANVAALGPSFYLSLHGGAATRLAAAANVLLQHHPSICADIAAYGCASSSAATVPALLCLDDRHVPAAQFFRRSFVDGQQAKVATPARVVAWRPFVVTYTGWPEGDDRGLHLANYMAALHSLAYDTTAAVVERPPAVNAVVPFNAIHLILNTTTAAAGGDTPERGNVNLLTRHFAQATALDISLADDLSSFVAGLLARPTIPPMVRSPFSNYFTGHFQADGHVIAEGYGGVVLAEY